MKLEKSIMLVSLGFGLVKQSTKISVQSQVDQDRVAASAKLYSSKGLKAITNHQAAIRTELITMAIQVPSGLRGAYILPADMASKISDFLESSKIKRESLVNDFIATDYEIEKDRARIALAGSFKDSDFPSITEVQKYFTMNYSFFTMELPRGIPAEMIESETAKFKTNLETVFSECRVVLRNALAELVGDLANKLKPDSNGNRKKLYTSGIEKLHNFLDTINSRDITSDSAIRELSEKAKKIIGDYSKDDMKVVSIGNSIQKNLSAVKSEIDLLIKTDGARSIDLDLE